MVNIAAKNPPLDKRDSDSCGNVHELTVRQIGSLEQEITQLEEIRTALVELRTACETNTVAVCPALIDMLGFEDSE